MRRLAERRPVLLLRAVARGGGVMSQKQRIANLLRDGPVCGTALLDLRMPRYAARIAELRAEGMLIETRRCESHRHVSAQVEYLVPSPTLF